MDFKTLLFTLSLLAPKNKPLVKSLQWFASALEEDAKLQGLTAGEQTILEIPDALDPKITSKGGKRFAIDGLVVKRLRG